MAAATQRIPVLVTVRQKNEIARLARAAGVSTGEFLRRAALSFRAADDDRILEGMAGQIERTTARASAVIDDALAYIEASNRRIAAHEARKKPAR